MGCIYKLTNIITNKVYIGKTTYNANERLKQHIKDSFGGTSKLYTAANIYGWESFEIEVIEDNIISDTELNKLEKYYIDKYDSFNNGYNGTLGGEGASIYSEKFKDNVVKVFKRTNSINETSNITGACNYTVRKILRSKNAYIDKHSESKGIVMYDKYFTPLRYFKSIREAVNFLGVDGRNFYTRIKKHFDGSLFLGYRWQLASELVYDNKIFRTTLDRDAYIDGETAYKVDDKQYWVVDGVISKILGYAKNNIQSTEAIIQNNTCIICGNHTKSKDNMCTECRLIKDVENININYLSIDNRCSSCGKSVGVHSKSLLCNSCSQVKIKGKSPKPSKEELKALLEQGLQKKQIADMYGRTDSTVHYWIKQYGLKSIVQNKCNIGDYSSG